MTTRNLSMAFIALMMISAAARASDPVQIAGGTLDPNFSDTDVYVGVPTSAKAASGAACRVAQDYITFVHNGQYDRVADLFSSSAVVLEPTRQHVQGRDAIAKFYAETIGRMKPDIVAVSYVGDETDCVVTIAVRERIATQPRYKLASVDHFTLDATGKVVCMVVFVRPPPAVPAH